MVFVLSFFLLLSFFFCFCCYISLFPNKSGFFFVFSVLFSLPFFSYFCSLEAYLVCMLFLGGLLVGLCYMTSLSSFSFGPHYWGFLFFCFFAVFFLLGGYSFLFFDFSYSYFSLLCVVHDFGYFWVVFWLVFLLFFMLFSLSLLLVVFSSLRKF